MTRRFQAIDTGVKQSVASWHNWEAICRIKFPRGMLGVDQSMATWCSWEARCHIRLKQLLSSLTIESKILRKKSMFRKSDHIVFRIWQLAAGESNFWDGLKVNELAHNLRLVCDGMRNTGASFVTIMLSRGGSILDDIMLKVPATRKALLQTE